MPTRADITDTSHLDFFIWMLICTDMCQHLKRCRNLGMCRHVKVPTPVILIIWTFLFANWDELACVKTWKSADTWEGTDTPRIRHVPTSLILIIWTFLFGCWYVLTHQHLKRCRHLGMCRHVKVPTPVILIIWTFLFANWDVLACVSTWKSADT